MNIGPIKLLESEFEALCKKWRIQRLWVFGSVGTPDFREQSDVDLLVEFTPEEQWSLMDLVRAEEEFADLLGHKVELVDRECLQRSTNWIRRDSILKSAEMIYAA